MNDIYLNEDEKRLLNYLNLNSEKDVRHFTELSKDRLEAAAEGLQEKGLIAAFFTDNEGLYDALLKEKGKAYLACNPRLDNPISYDIEQLQKENLKLQNNELEYQKNIRAQQAVIRWWQLLNILFGIIGGIGWFLYLFKFIK